MLLRSDRSAEAGSSLPPLPAFIRLPQGDISYASRAPDSPYAGKRSRRSAAQKAGLAYQRKVEDILCPSFLGSDLSFLDRAPWFYYVDGSGKRHYVQPDLLLTNRFGVDCVAEIKIRWTSDAWWQVRRLYIPVLRAALQRELLPLVITRSYDPAIRIPEEVHFAQSFADLHPKHFNVLVWRP